MAKLRRIVAWVGVVLVLAAGAVWLLTAAQRQDAVWGAWAGLALVVSSMLSQWRRIPRLLRRRRARLGTLALTSVLVVVALLAAVNFLASRQHGRWDLTSAKYFTLSAQTRQVLQGLDAPMKVLVFAQERDFDRFRDRLREYEYASRYISVEYVDADRRPSLAERYQIQAYGTVVFEYMGRVERVVSDTEQDLTDGLIKAISGQRKTMYFVQGHGERDVGSSERTQYSSIALALGRDNFNVEKLALTQHNALAVDASVIVIAGPKTDYLPTEVQALRDHLRQGGKLLALVDPPDKPDAPALTNLTALFREWGFDLGNDIVVDISGLGRLTGTDASVPVATNYSSSHPITSRFNLLTAYPLARSVSPIGGQAQKQSAIRLIETSSDSWAETDIATYATSGAVRLEQDKGDRNGPIAIGAVLSAPIETQDRGPETPHDDDTSGARPTETRIAIIGDSDFVANHAISIGGNSDLFLNIVNWLAQQDNLITIRTKEPSDRRITLTADQQRRIAWLSLVVIPGLIFASGVHTWWQRRK